MNTSEIIALVAIAISALVSIVATITSYRNTRLNIQSRRSEMAFEKQIDAFREIAEKMGGIRKAIINSLVPYDDLSERTFFHAIEKANLDYHFTYQKYRVYLPSELDAALRDFEQKVISYYSNADYQKHSEFLDEFNKLEPAIIKIMNRHMGIN
jgi:hypothetical protein